MELNRDEILKWWELCANDITCRKCPYEKVGNCQGELMQATLDIFKELNEKVENYRNTLGEVRVALAEANDDNKKLTKENERLRNSTIDYRNIPYSKEEVRADTVRKMQNELKRTFSALCKGEMSDLFRIIDQIADEMIGEAK